MTTLKKAARNLIRAKRNNLRNEMKELRGMERRTDCVSAFLETMPQKVLGRSVIDWSIYGNTIYVSVRPMYKRFTENDTLLVTDWCGSLSEKWRFDKSLNSDGTWYHEIKRWIGSLYVNVTFETTSNIDGCEIIESEEVTTRKVYRVKCD